MLKRVRQPLQRVLGPLGAALARRGVNPNVVTFVGTVLTTSAALVLYPRGDLRRTTERMPSRFLLDTTTALAGRRLYADDLEGMHADWFTPVPSFAAGLARVEFPATEQEHRLRSLLAHTA